MSEVEYNHTDEVAGEIAKADAKDRSIRTLFQNLWLDVAFVLLPLVYDAVSGWDGSFSAQYWTIVGAGLVKTGALAVIAYFMRLKKSPKNVEA